MFYYPGILYRLHIGKISIVSRSNSDMKIILSEPFSSIMYDPIIDRKGSFLLVRLFLHCLYLAIESDTEIYSFVTDEKSGCSTHCPVNKGHCKYYNSITDFCRIHCTTDCLFTPRDNGNCFVFSV